MSQVHPAVEVVGETISVRTEETKLRRPGAASETTPITVATKPISDQTGTEGTRRTSLKREGTILAKKHLVSVTNRVKFTAWDAAIESIGLVMFVLYLMKPIDTSYKGDLFLPHVIFQWFILCVRIMGALYNLSWLIKRPSVMSFMDMTAVMMISPFRYIPALMVPGYYKYWYLRLSGDMKGLHSGPSSTLQKGFYSSMYALIVVPFVFFYPLIGCIYLYVDMSRLNFNDNLFSMPRDDIFFWILFFFNVRNMKNFDPHAGVLNSLGINYQHDGFWNGAETSTFILKDEATYNIYKGWNDNPDVEFQTLTAEGLTEADFAKRVEGKDAIISGDFRVRASAI